MRFRAGLVLLLCGIVLYGCAAEQTEARERKSVTAPQDIQYVVKNALTIEYKTESGNGFSGVRFEVSGLKDKAVEQRINEALLSIYHMYDDGKLPEYAKVSGTIKEDMTPKMRSVNMAATYNADNVLSVLTSFGWVYQLKDAAGADYEEELSCSQPLNLELLSGGEIVLSDVFCDDVDYKAQMARYLIREVTGEEKFVLWDSGQIQFIPDYGSPEFELSDGEEKAIFMPFNEKVAVTKRYYDAQESLFLHDEEPVKWLLSTEKYEGLLLKELFNNPDNYEKILKEALVKKFKNAQAKGSAPRHIDADVYAGEIIGKITGYQLNMDSVELFFDEETLKEPLARHAVYLTFEQLGCGNLSLFE